jgi:predicted amidohydrolase
VTTILGFTEVDRGRLYNSAAVCHRGSVAGIYRKRHPAINRSVYDAGEATPVFTVGTFTFGILICRDSRILSSRKQWHRAVRLRFLFRRTMASRLGVRMRTS